MSITIDINILQTLPPSNINRDDTGAPKTAVFGGVVRQRVSSQAQKRAVRKHFDEYLDREKLGIRSLRCPSLIFERARSLAPEQDIVQQRDKIVEMFDVAAEKDEKTLLKKPMNANKVDKKAISKLFEDESYMFDTKALLFLSEKQITAAAEFVVKNINEKLNKTKLGDILKDKHSIDIAMFGRMLADVADYNVDAAVQVAHAIGVHESGSEFDFFTAVDDVKENNEESGAGMLGTVQMMSSTLYRYASIDFLSLERNLGSNEAAVQAAVAFVKSFVLSMPTGKLNTFANWTLPELVYVTVRDTRAVSLVNAFETPVNSGAGRREAAAKKLANEAKELQKAYGLTSQAAWVFGLQETVSEFSKIAKKTTFNEMLEGLEEQLKVTEQ